MVANDFIITAVVLTYNCEKFLEKTISKIPINNLNKIIFSDDGSNDKTIDIIKKNGFLFIQNDHKGYGGNLFAGLKKAFDDGASYVVEIHGDGQYLENDIDKLRKLIIEQKPDIVLGDRFLNKNETLKYGMPPHIFYGNIFLSFLAKLGLGFHLNDFFPGFRVYSKKFFDEISNFKLSNGYQFSFEIIAVAKLLNLKISSIPVVCNYKDEKQTAPIWYIVPCLLNLILTSLKYRLAKFGLNISIFKKK